MHLSCSSHHRHVQVLPDTTALAIASKSPTDTSKGIKQTDGQSAALPPFKQWQADVSHDRIDIMFWPSLTCSGIARHNTTGNRIEKPHHHIQKRHTTGGNSAAFPFFKRWKADVSHDHLDIVFWPSLTSSSIARHNTIGNRIEKPHHHIQKRHTTGGKSAAFPSFKRWKADVSHDHLDIVFWPSLTSSSTARHNTTGNRIEKLHHHIQKRHTNCWKKCGIPFFQTMGSGRVP